MQNAYMQNAYKAAAQLSTAVQGIGFNALELASTFFFQMDNC